MWSSFREHIMYTACAVFTYIILYNCIIPILISVRCSQFLVDDHYRNSINTGRLAGCLAGV